MPRSGRGDDEGPKEWDGRRQDDTGDRAGDDDVNVAIRADGRVDVAYRCP